MDRSAWPTRRLRLGDREPDDDGRTAVDYADLEIAVGRLRDLADLEDLEATDPR